MAQKETFTTTGQVYFYSSIDSTNYYAIKLIAENQTSHGDTFWSLTQTKGRGQRGKVWNDKPGDSLLMSLVVKPNLEIKDQFLFSMAVALTIAKYLQTILTDNIVKVKWPNDIYIDDKKAVGILIENTIRGNNWEYAVIGMGINVKQTYFPEELSNAISLKMASGKEFDLAILLSQLRAYLLETLSALRQSDEAFFLNDFNQMLFAKGNIVTFQKLDNLVEFSAKVIGVNEDGNLILETYNGIELHSFGTLKWLI